MEYGKKSEFKLSWIRQDPIWLKRYNLLLLSSENIERFINCLEIWRCMKKHSDDNLVTVVKKLGISFKDALELIKIGDLKKATLPKRTGKLGEVLSYLDVYKFLISKKSMDDLPKKTYPEDEIKNNFFHSNLTDLKPMLQELTRFDPDYKERLKNTRLVWMHNKESIILSKTQVNYLLDDVSKETRIKAGQGATIMAADKISGLKPKGKTIDDVITGLGLSINTANRKRVLGYHIYESAMQSKADIPPVLNMTDEGKIKKFVYDSPLDDAAKLAIYSELFILYLCEYAGDKVFLSKKEKRWSKLLKGGVDLRTTEENIENLKEAGLTPFELSELIFNFDDHPDMREYILKKGEYFDIAELIQEETSIFTDQKIEIECWGNGKYHELDSAFLKHTLKEEKLFDKIYSGVEFKVGFESYKSKSREDVEGLTIKQAAAELGITCKRAKELGIFVDVGFISEFAKKTGKSDDEVEKFYNEYFKNKVEGFSDGTVRNWRVNRNSLDTFIGRLKRAPFDLDEANEELARQYAIDGQEGQFLDIPKHFTVNNETLYNKEAIEKMAVSMKNG